jgi:hypothetical protein
MEGVIQLFNYGTSQCTIYYNISSSKLKRSLRCCKLKKNKRIFYCVYLCKKYFNKINKMYGPYKYLIPEDSQGLILNYNLSLLKIIAIIAITDECENDS